MYPKKFELLIDSFQKLTGVGAKSAERYAFEVLEWDKEDRDMLIEAMIGLESDIHKCKECGNLSEDELCEICKDQSRDHTVICVVQQVRDIAAMEKIHEYTGIYHVLNGVINTSKGILPDDLNIDYLLERINETTKEVIIATNPTVEGETTALYLAKLLEKKNVTVTRLAHGLPMGGHLDYADELTLLKAMENRIKL